MTGLTHIYGDGVNIAARIEALADLAGVFVSNRVHDHVRDRLPFVFEDLREQQVKKHCPPVRVYRLRGSSGAAKSSSPPAHPVLLLPDKPSIAVLPFANMSGDPEQEYFVDGMVEEVITALFCIVGCSKATKAPHSEFDDSAGRI